MSVPFLFAMFLRRISRDHIDVLQCVAKDLGFAERPFLTRECPRSRSGISREYRLYDLAKIPRPARTPVECEERTSYLLGPVC